MYIHKWSIGKVGGGVLKSAEDITKLPNVIRLSKVNVLVVSAFYEKTRLLQEVIDSRDSALFDGAFLDYHRELFTALKLKGSLHELCGELIQTFEFQFSLLCIAKVGTPAEDRAKASILALGEDFSSVIVGEFLRQEMTGMNVQNIEARAIIATEQGKFVNAEFDQRVTAINVSGQLRPLQDTLYVVQGFIGSVGANGTDTSVLALDGSDVTAALIAASLGGSLTYFKRSKDGERLPTRTIGIGRLVDYTKKTNRTVVSPQIQWVDNLPPYLTVWDYEDDRHSFYVTLGQEVIDLWRRAQQSKEETE